MPYQDSVQKWPAATSDVRPKAHPMELPGSRSPAFGNSSKNVASWSRCSRSIEKPGATSWPVPRSKGKLGFPPCYCIAQARRVRSDVRCQSAGTQERPHVSATDRSQAPQNGASNVESRKEDAVPLSDSEGEEATPPMPWPVSPEKVPELRPPAEPSPEIVAAAAKVNHRTAAAEDGKHPNKRPATTTEAQTWRIHVCTLQQDGVIRIADLGNVNTDWRCCFESWELDSKQVTPLHRFLPYVVRMSPRGVQVHCREMHVIRRYRGGPLRTTVALM
jgi:hypothetical protein